MSSNEILIDVPPRTVRSRNWSPGATLLLMGGPVLVFLSEVIAPRHPDDLSPAQDAAFIVGNSDRLLVSWLVGLVAAAVLAAAFVLVSTRLRGRGRIVGRVSAVLGVAGAVGLGGHMANELLVRDLMLQDAGVAATIAEAEFGVAAVSTVFPVIFGITFGLILIAVAAFRAGWVGWWVIVVAVLAFVADWSPTAWATTLFAAMATVVLGAIAASSGRRLD